MLIPAVPWNVKVKKPELTSEWDVDECCYVCQRKFNEKYDPKDANEIACSPMRRACGHLIGSECWKQFLNEDFMMSECPYECLAQCVQKPSQRPA